MIRSTKIILKNSPLEGFGVFASEDILAGEILEEVPFILLDPIIDAASKFQNFLSESSLLSDELKYKDNLRQNLGFKSVAKYIFKYYPPVTNFNGKEVSYCVLPLGYACIYNTSNGNNNAEWSIKDKIFTFKACSDIKAGEEVKTFYGYFMSEDGQDWNIDSVFNLGLETRDGGIFLDGLKFASAESQVKMEKGQGFSRIVSLFGSVKNIKLMRGYTVDANGQTNSSVVDFSSLKKLSSYYGVLKKFKESGRAVCLELGFELLGKECREQVIL